MPSNTLPMSWSKVCVNFADIFLFQNPHSKVITFLYPSILIEKSLVYSFAIQKTFGFFLENFFILFSLFEFKLHTPESAEQVITAYDQNFLWVHRYYLVQQSKFKNWLIGFLN